MGGPVGSAVTAQLKAAHKLSQADLEPSRATEWLTALKWLRNGSSHFLNAIFGQFRAQEWLRNGSMPYPVIYRIVTCKYSHSSTI